MKQEFDGEIKERETSTKKEGARGAFTLSPDSAWEKQLEHADTCGYW